MDYNFKEIEAKWQQYWADNNSFKTTDDFSKPKFYCLDMFPYPSGAGLACRTSRRIYRHRYRLPVQAEQRVQRASPDGLGCVWLAC